MILFLTLLFQEPIEIINFNVESGQASIEHVATQVAEYQGCDLWAFVEVQDDHWAKRLEEAAESGENQDFTPILGSTGREDKLLIVFDSSKFEYLKHFELDHVNIKGRVRAPLVALLIHKKSGQKFYLMVNHLYRGSAEGRHEQAKLLNAWAEKSKLPILAVGDFNFDWDIDHGDVVHDPGYDYFVENVTFTWVKPKRIYKTHTDPKYNTLLDFVFVSGQAQRWKISSEVLLGWSGPKDDMFRSDHEPIRSLLHFPEAAH